MATQTLMTFEQFSELPEQEGVRLELDEGRVIEMPDPSFLHGAVQGRIYRLLLNTIERARADFYISQHTPFRLAPDVVRSPDVCLVGKSRYAAMERVRGALQGAPDLAVEVVSPSETALDLDRRIHQYLRAGTTSVWSLYSETRHLMIHRRSGEVRNISSGQSFDEPELLPGATFALDEILAGIEELEK